jgi:hypothetical protein
MSQIPGTTEPTTAHYLCPRTGRPIDLDDLSVCRWDERTRLVWCPACGTFHTFEVQHEHS